MAALLIHPEANAPLGVSVATSYFSKHILMKKTAANKKLAFRVFFSYKLIIKNSINSFIPLA